MKDWSLRPVSEDDWSKIYPIEVKEHRSPWTVEHFKKEQEKPYSRTWVLTDDATDEEVAGYAVFWVLGEEAELLNLVVASAYQRKGYGRFILSKVVHTALKEGAKALKLDVRKSNLSAIQLYQSAGFVTVHIRKGFYSDGEAAYHMSLDLTHLNHTGESGH